MLNGPTIEPIADPTLADLVTALDAARRRLEDAESAVGSAHAALERARRHRGRVRRDYADALTRYEALRANARPADSTAGQPDYRDT